LLYHGQTVSFEWQSKQDCFNTATTSGGPEIVAVAGGFVREG
jgi:hypothetical protein